jgi:hypothetical protein
MNLRQIEKLLIAHLQESGEIRADLKWVKRAVWTLAAGVVSWNVAVVSYLLLRSR